MASTSKRIRLDGCCNIVTGERIAIIFERPMSISEEDLLSNLNFDCLREIFHFFDHDNLDEISLVSQKLNALSSDFRGTAKKKKATALTLHMNDRGKTLLFASGIRQLMLISHDNEGNLKMEQTWAIPRTEFNNKSTTQKKPTQIACPIFRRMNFFLERYQFISIKIEWVLINNAFLDHSERIFNFHAPPELHFHETTFGSDMQALSMQRFTDWILSMRLEKVSFKNTKLGTSGAVNAEFLGQFSNNVASPSLVIEEREATNRSSLIFASRDMIDDLAKYSDLNINYNIVVDAAWAMELIKARFRRYTKGEWGISTTRKLREAEIIVCLDEDMQHEQENGDEHRIRLTDASNKSNFVIHLFREEEFTKMDVEFDEDYDEDAESD